MTTDLYARAATPADAADIARIYNQGTEDRNSTFETRPRTAQDIEGWFGGPYPIVIVERAGQTVAWASTSRYRPRDCYAGIAEFSVYVERSARGTGAGTAAMLALIRAATEAGCWKLLSRVFPENRASLALLGKLGFRADFIITPFVEPWPKRLSWSERHLYRA